jgi:hypothetical protein
MLKDKDRVSRRIAALSAAKPLAAPPPAATGRRTPRIDDRRQVFRFGCLVLDDKSELRCILKDISASGARVALEGAHALPPIVLLKVDMTGEKKRAAVVWQKESEAGLSFRVRMV